MWWFGDIMDTKLVEGKPNWICLITKWEREGESKELHVFLLTKPFHTGLYKGLNAICYL